MGKEAGFTKSLRSTRQYEIDFKLQLYATNTIENVKKFTMSGIMYKMVFNDSLA